MDFRTELMNRASSWEMSENPLVQGVQAGRFSREALAIYGRRLEVITELFPRLLAHLMAICPNWTLRQHSLANLMEEEAFFFKKGQLTGSESKSHLGLVRRFQAHLPPPPEDSWHNENRQLTRWLAEGAWPAVAAFLFIGMEHSTPSTFEKIIPALRTHYSLSDYALNYFIVHLGADVIHSARGADMLAAHCHDAESQALALEGASLGGRSWYLFHSLCARDMVRMDACPVPRSH
ncbi:MAG: iron-containing redox enzyme family protein [Planctomycetota bacterium]